METGSRRNAVPPINAVRNESFMKLDAATPTTATVNPKTTQRICCRSSSGERRYRRINDVTETASITGNRMPITGSGSPSVPTAST